MNSGMAAIVTILVLFRWSLHLESYITEDHLDAIGRLQIAIGVTWLFFYFLDFAGSVVSQDARDVDPWMLRFFTWPYPLLMAVMFLTAFFIPVPLWLFRRVRRNAAAMLWIAVLVNIGMWIERLTIVVPPLVYNQAFTFVWAWYFPSWVEMTIILGSVAFAGFGILIFAKIFPIVPIFSEKEGQILKAEIDVGHREVPAIIRE
jgi:molybdopterin-containing oxidoreductase family membrane subunit